MRGHMRVRSHIIHWQAYLSSLDLNWNCLLHPLLVNKGLLSPFHIIFDAFIICFFYFMLHYNITKQTEIKIISFHNWLWRSWRFWWLFFTFLTLKVTFLLHSIFKDLSIALIWTCDYRDLWKFSNSDWMKNICHVCLFSDIK